MKVTVKLYNRLRDYAPDENNVFSLQMPHGAPMGQLLQRLNIPNSVQRTILINGRRGDENTVLSPGDEVVMMSPIEGG
jgi:molybdopterin converting factor small subunit